MLTEVDTIIRKLRVILYRLWSIRSDINIVLYTKRNSLFLKLNDSWEIIC